MLITKSEAARAIGKSRQWIDQIFHDRPRPLYFVRDGKTKKGEWIWKVDTEHTMWKAALQHYEEKDGKKENRAKEKKNKILLPEVIIDKGAREEAKQRARKRVQKPLSEEDEKYIDELNVKSMLAKIEKEIYKNELTKEKVEQERIRTLELKREVAPMLLMIHWWSYKENLTQRIFRRPVEISPEVEALYLAHEPRKAEQKIIRELEAIIIDVHNELIADINKEGFKMPEKKEGDAITK